MLRHNVIVAALALGSLAALPACSSMNGSSSQASAAPMKPIVASSMVKQVQTTLQAQNLYKGNIDGVYGPETAGAVMSYQKSHNLTANGQLDSPTLASLNLQGDSSNTTSSAAPATTSAATPAPAPSTTAAAPAAPAPTASAATTPPPATTTTQ